MKIHHVAFSVSDIVSSIDWYEKNLGFKKSHGVERDFGTFALLTNTEGENIELIQHPNSLPLPEQRKDLFDDIQQICTKHLALQVDDIQSTLRDLQSNGVEQVRPIGDAFYDAKYTFIKDPDGNLIVIVELNKLRIKNEEI